MAYICELCGETVVDEKICDCVIEQKKEALKNRKKKYFVYRQGDRDIIKTILNNRKIDIDSEDFLEAAIDGLLETPFLNEPEAVEKIISAIKNKKKIGIYGDYDADGITGISVAVSILRRLGADVTYYANNRFTEGFGICLSGVEALKEENVDLIITVDNGIAGIEGVKSARALGMEVIVTDHHEPNDILPDALIVDPKQPECTYPNKEITGVGVIFKILLRVCVKLDRRNLALKQLDLVALGTVADLGALVGENRVIVKNGLKLWNWNKCRPNLQILKEAAGISKDISSYELGFIFGPILNAEGRLYGKPQKAIEVLIEEDLNIVQSLAKSLVEMNEKRKKSLDEQMILADKQVDPDKDFLFIYDSKIEEGLAGLIASRILEMYKKPTIVLGRDNQQNIKGSGRSVPCFNLKEALDNVKDLLLKYGGHNVACGLSLEENQLVIVKNILETKAKKVFNNQENIDKIYFDGCLSIHHLNEGFLNVLEALEPFGLGFKKPSFLIRDIYVDQVQYLKEKHSKFKVGGIDFIVFNQIVEPYKKYHFGGFPKWNVYNGRKSIQFIINHILDEETDICELEI